MRAEAKIVRKALLVVGVALVLGGGLLIERVEDPFAGRMYPVQVPLAVRAGSAVTQRFTARSRDLYSVVVDVEPTDEQWEAWRNQPASRDLLPAEPLRVSYSVRDGDRIVAEGLRADPPSLDFHGEAMFGLVVASFNGNWGRTYTIDLRIEGPVPDYGKAITSLVVAASPDRQDGIVGSVLEQALSGLVLFCAGAILLLALLLNTAFRWRRARAPARRRRSVNLDGVQASEVRAGQGDDGAGAD